MSLSDKLTSLNTAKQNLKTAFINKGYDMSSTPFTEYSTLIINLYSIQSLCDYFISPDGNDNNKGTYNSPFLTLNRALSSSSTVQSIGVLSGTYTGTSNCNLTITKTINIYGENSVIFDGESTRRSGWILGDSTNDYYINIRNITFKNSSNNSYGGAINITSYSYCTITDCTFTNNNASNGGGIYNKGKSHLINCIFINNNAINGGGIYLDNLLYISNCTFKNNTATNEGGAIYSYSTCYISNCDFFITTSTNIRGGTAIDGCYWNTSTPTSSSYNSTLYNCVPTNDRTTPNHPERIT